MTDTLHELASQDQLTELTREYSAHNYHPLPVVVASAAGSWVTGVDGRRYLDMLAGYSALNFGHLHPRLVEARRGSFPGSPWSRGRLTMISSGRSARSSPSCARWRWCSR